MGRYQYLPSNFMSEEISSFVAAALCKSYKTAKEKNSSISMYYDNLASTIPRSTAIAWETSMDEAEHIQLETPSAMDILKAKQSAHQNGTQSASAAIARLPEDNLPISRWFYLAMQIEENQ